MDRDVNHERESRPQQLQWMSRGGRIIWGGDEWSGLWANQQ